MVYFLAVVLLGQTVALVWRFRRPPDAGNALEPPDYTQVFDAIDARFELLTEAVASGIAHVERSEARVRATVARARQELGQFGIEHPGLEAEGEELRFGDGGGSEEEGLPPVHEDVAEGGSSIPGVSAEVLARRWQAR